MRQGRNLRHARTLFRWESAAPVLRFSAIQDAGKWYYSAIETANGKRRVLNGTVPFSGEDDITRKKLAIMLVRTRSATYAGSGVVNYGMPFYDVTQNSDTNDRIPLRNHSGQRHNL
jgi:hypothetical protein